MVNRLSMESSPYLKEHADNPVDWYPWGEEALLKAKELDRPIFLSIGYSSCHWCHKMNEDCFMDIEVANLMNNAFINVKVDREERPDLDSFFMKASIIMTGSGGWPLNIIMTSDLRPFFAATYIPKNSSYGMRGMIELIPLIEDLWKNRRKELLDYGNRLINAMSSGAPAKADADCFEKLMFEIGSSFDDEYGGFGTAPKFPNYSAIMLLLASGKFDMASKTLIGMMNGAIFDQLEYGFHRYSTDRSWNVPHFEKMLYDQALSIICYTEAYRAIGAPKFAKCVDRLTQYIKKRLLSNEGGFYSSEDADSEGEEGKYYTVFDVEKRLPLNLLEFAKRNMLVPFNDGYLVRGTDDESNAIQCIELLRKLRDDKLRPKVDYKILTDWNAMTIASLAFASYVFERNDLLNIARGAFKFIEDNMMLNGELKHCFTDGKSKIDGMLEDYAFMIWAALELYEASLDDAYLQKAMDLLKMVNFKFKNKNGIFYRNNAPPLVMETEDYVIPSGNSTMLYNLLRLYTITGDDAVREQFNNLENGIKPYACEQPFAHAFYYWVNKINELGPRCIILAGRRSDALELRDKLLKVYLPGSVVVFRDENDPSVDRISKITSTYQSKNGRLTAYICGNSYCSQPLYNYEEIMQYLKKSAL